MPMFAMWNNPTAIIIIAIVVLVLFGGSKIPEMMKGLGTGMKEFKRSMNDDDELRQDRERLAHNNGTPPPVRDSNSIDAEVQRRVDEQLRREREARAPSSAPVAPDDKEAIEAEIQRRVAEELRLRHGGR